jgi:hypothetical protein
LPHAQAEPIRSSIEVVKFITRRLIFSK